MGRLEGDGERRVGIKTSERGEGGGTKRLEGRGEGKVERGGRGEGLVKEVMGGRVEGFGSGGKREREREGWRMEEGW